MLKIAVTGPESTGKSYLAGRLAGHYKGCFVPEYARTYLDSINRDYHQEDLSLIAQGQLLAEQKAAETSSGYIFCDTDMLVLKIWYLHKYKNCPEFILKYLEKKKYDLHLLCDIDLPWEYDPQREHPHLRKFFFDWYKKELQDYGLPFFVISGKDDIRVKNAIEVIDNFSFHLILPDGKGNL